MCHQSTVTGSAAAAEGSVEAAALGAAALGAAALAGATLADPPLEQALIVSARTPSNPSVRFDMTGPPVIRHSSSVGAAHVRFGILLWRSWTPVRRIGWSGARKFRSDGRRLLHRTLAPP